MTRSGESGFPGYRLRLRERAVRRHLPAAGGAEGDVPARPLVDIVRCWLMPESVFQSRS